MEQAWKPDFLDALVFDNRFVRELPADPQTENRRREVTGACYSRVEPKPVARPQLAAYAREVAELLELPGELDAWQTQEIAQVFGGNRKLSGMEFYATCYGGHQFGTWAGQLGDGRVIHLGEVINRAGQRWALQLKGAGSTPYSRTADGRAVLRSSLREFLCSEAMHHLGVPTTRALSLVLTGEQVERDMFYDGHPRLEPGAVVCRVAPSFTRFGNFQICTARGDVALLQKLVDYTLRADFPHLGEPSPEVYAAWFAEVCRLTADLLTHWMRVGFVHGVMNTDNMSILGLTIDYGPYGWLENYDPNWTPNTTDAGGRRYCFGRQPQIAQWNLLQLAKAIAPLFETEAPLETALNGYADRYRTNQQAMLAAKLGLAAFDPATDEALFTELLAVLQLVETDMTIFYRKLAYLDADVAYADDASDEALMAPLADAYYQPGPLPDAQQKRIGAWLRSYLRRARRDNLPDEIRRRRMNAVNPHYVLRNYLAQLAIDRSEQGDHSLLQELLEVLRRPYEEQPGKEEFAGKRPEWARERAGCSMLSCSS